MTPQVAETAMVASEVGSTELDDFFSSLGSRAYIHTYMVNDHPSPGLSNSSHHLVFIDSQASSFVVPTAELLFCVINHQPHRPLYNITRIKLELGVTYSHIHVASLSYVQV